MEDTANTRPDTLLMWQESMKRYKQGQQTIYEIYIERDALLRKLTPFLTDIDGVKAREYLTELKAIKRMLEAAYENHFAIVDDLVLEADLSMNRRRR